MLSAQVVLALVKTWVLLQGERCVNGVRAELNFGTSVSREK